MSEHALLSTNGHAPLGNQRVPHGEITVLTMLVCNGPEFTAARNSVLVTCKPGTSRRKSSHKFSDRRFVSPINDLGLRQAALTHKDLDHAIEIASGLKHRPLGKTTANLDHTIETRQARPIDQPSGPQARTSL